MPSDQNDEFVLEVQPTANAVERADNQRDVRRAKTKATLDMYKMMSPDERQEHFRALQKLMPAESLSDVDLEHEMLKQYRDLVDLQSDLLNDDDTPLNQRAQLANSVGTILDRIIKAQEAVYTQERFKRIEAALINWLRAQPNAEELLKSYENILESIR